MLINLINLRQTYTYEKEKEVWDKKNAEIERTVDIENWFLLNRGGVHTSFNIICTRRHWKVVSLIKFPESDQILRFFFFFISFNFSFLPITFNPPPSQSLSSPLIATDGLHWRSSDSKSPDYYNTIFSNLPDFNNDFSWEVSVLPQITNSIKPSPRLFKIVPSKPLMMDKIVTFWLNNIFPFSYKV